jgi:hypothetical protein
LESEGALVSQRDARHRRYFPGEGAAFRGDVVERAVFRRIVDAVAAGVTSQAELATLLRISRGALCSHLSNLVRWGVLEVMDADIKRYALPRAPS